MRASVLTVEVRPHFLHIYTPPDDDGEADMLPFVLKLAPT